MTTTMDFDQISFDEIPRAIAARLIGCSPALIEKYLAKDRLHALSNGNLSIDEVENMAARIIAPIEIQLAYADQELRSQLRSLKHQQAIAYGDYTDLQEDWS